MIGSFIESDFPSSTPQKYHEEDNNYKDLDNLPKMREAFVSEGMNIYSFDMKLDDVLSSIRSSCIELRVR